MYHPGFHPGTVHPAPELGRLGQPPAAMRGDGEGQTCPRTQPGIAAGDMPGAMHWPEGEMAAWIESRPKGHWNRGWSAEDWRAYREEVEDPPHQTDLDRWATWGYGDGAQGAYGAHDGAQEEGGQWSVVPQRHARPTRLTHAQGQSGIQIPPASVDRPRAAGTRADASGEQPPIEIAAGQGPAPEPEAPPGEKLRLISLRKPDNEVVFK